MSGSKTIDREFFRRKGALGARRRMEKLTPEQRSEAARRAWQTKRAKQKLQGRAAGYRSKEMDWITRHGTQFAGLWVAVEGDELIASDREAKVVFAAARARGIERPFVVHLEPADALPFGGW